MMCEHACLWYLWVWQQYVLLTLTVASTYLILNAMCHCLLQSVLRRLRAQEAVARLQSTVAPMLGGSTTNALLLDPSDFAAKMRTATLALADVATLVLAPECDDDPHQPGSSRHHSPGVQAQQADISVLQLMLSYSTVDLTASLFNLSALHYSKLKSSQNGLQVASRSYAASTYIVFHSYFCKACRLWIQPTQCFHLYVVTQFFLAASGHCLSCPFLGMLCPACGRQTSLGTY